MSNVMDWLLAGENPGTRYLALRDLCGLPADDPELLAAQQAAHAHGPIAAVLEHMHPDGYWSQLGPGYNPKYFSSVWSLILLSQLGASAALDERIQRACAYILEAGLTIHGQFSASGAPSGTADCLHGNLCEALVSLGYDDPRLEQAYEWMARSLTARG